MLSASPALYSKAALASVESPWSPGGAWRPVPREGLHPLLLPPIASGRAPGTGALLLAARRNVGCARSGRETVRPKFALRRIGEVAARTCSCWSRWWAPGDSNPEPADQESGPKAQVRGVHVL
jgi:hypothetical protein